MYKKLMISAALMATLVGGWAVAEDKPAEAAKAPVPVAAAPAPAAAAPVAAAPAVATVTGEGVPAGLADKMKPAFGSAPDSLKPTPVPGVFEAMFGGEVIYVSADGRYVFTGNLIDAQTKTSLTEEARSTTRKLAMGKLDSSKTIEYKAKGTEKHVLYVFTDVECPFCVKLHHEVPALNDKGVTVRYFAYPRAGIGSPSYKKMVNVWCADDKKAALDKIIKGEENPAKDCANPVADDFALGQKLGVDGTPALLTEDGTMIPGFRPADELVSMLDKAKAKGAAK
jgi:thiol:disulfide interchange protein DsbC